MASVRFICGTQDMHKQLEAAIARFLGKDDAILYSSCWDANGGLFETILGEEDAILSDELNHASIIDGIRLCKAKRVPLQATATWPTWNSGLKEAQGSRLRLIATDGVFSMDGALAPLPEICDLADRYDALVMVDDSHATGILGAGGRGTPEQLGVLDRIDIITSTLGKTLGGAAGGFTCGRAGSRRFPAAAVAAVPVLERLPPPIVMRRARRRWSWSAQSSDLRDRLHANAQQLRAGLEAAGFTLKPGQHPIMPVMLGDAALASQHGGQAAGAGHLRHRLQLPRGAAGPGAHSHPGVGGAHRPSRSTAPSRRSRRWARNWASRLRVSAGYFQPRS